MSAIQNMDAANIKTTATSQVAKGQAKGGKNDPFAALMAALASVSGAAYQGMLPDQTDPLQNIEQLAQQIQKSGLMAAGKKQAVFGTLKNSALGSRSNETPITEAGKGKEQKSGAVSVRGMKDRAEHGLVVQSGSVAVKETRSETSSVPGKAGKTATAAVSPIAETKSSQVVAPPSVKKGELTAVPPETTRLFTAEKKPVLARTPSTASLQSTNVESAGRRMVIKEIQATEAEGVGKGKQGESFKLSAPRTDDVAPKRAATAVTMQGGAGTTAQGKFASTAQVKPGNTAQEMAVATVQEKSVTRERAILKVNTPRPSKEEPPSQKESPALQSETQVSEARKPVAPVLKEGETLGRTVLTSKRERDESAASGKETFKTDMTQSNATVTSASSRFNVSTTALRMTPSSFPTQFVEYIEMHLSSLGYNGVHRATISVEPPHMGKIDIELKIQGDHVKATFVASTQAVKSILDSSMADLHNSFSDAGFGQGEIDVFVRDDGSKGSQDRERPEHRGIRGAGAVGLAENLAQAAMADYAGERLVNVMA